MLGTNGIQIAAALLFDFLQILGEEFNFSKILEALQTQLSKKYCTNLLLHSLEVCDLAKSNMKCL